MASFMRFFSTTTQPSVKPAEDVYALVLRAFGSAPWNCSAKKVRDGLSYAYGEKGFYGVLAYNEKNRLVGAALAARSLCSRGIQRLQLMTLCTEPERQGSGIGSQLLQKVIQTSQMRKDGCVDLVTLQGSPAVSFYMKKGFLVETPSPDYPDMLQMRFHMGCPSCARS